MVSAGNDTFLWIDNDLYAKTNVIKVDSHLNSTLTKYVVAKLCLCREAVFPPCNFSTVPTCSDTEPTVYMSWKRGNI